MMSHFQSRIGRTLSCQRIAMSVAANFIMLLYVRVCVCVHGDVCGCAGVKRLRNILRSIAEAFPEIGYCQGTGMVRVLLVDTCPCFVCFLRLCSRLWYMQCLIRQLCID